MYSIERSDYEQYSSLIYIRCTLEADWGRRKCTKSLCFLFLYLSFCRVKRRNDIRERKNEEGRREGECVCLTIRLKLAECVRACVLAIDVTLSVCHFLLAATFSEMSKDYLEGHKIFEKISFHHTIELRSNLDIL